MDLTLKIWRQKAPRAVGGFCTYQLSDVSEEWSFFEMLDHLNNKLIANKDSAGPVAFDSDCREGICGTCGLMINGQAHGPLTATTTCQLHMRSFKSAKTIHVEPFRADAFPVIRDLVVDRSSLDKIIQSGGYISVTTGGAAEANSLPVAKSISDQAMDQAACIGCGACVATCKNASAMLFTSAKLTHLNLLPQGQPEKYTRTKNMIQAMEDQGFGNCTNEGECEAVCPKEISIGAISYLNRNYLASLLKQGEV